MVFLKGESVTEKPLIILKNEHCTVCVKPAGVTSEDGKSLGMPSILAEGGKKPLVVHRLDREVGGVMVFANDAKTAAELSRQIADRKFGKEYLAVVSGDVEADGVLEDLLFYDRQRSKTYVVKRERKGVKPASLEFRRLAVAKTENGTLSLVKIRLHTGRTHQIRVQFGSRKHPVAGDRKYGSDENCQTALFSHKIFFSLNGKSCEFKALPENVYPWSLFGEILCKI